jgi:hypothetical protein
LQRDKFPGKEDALALRITIQPRSHGSENKIMVDKALPYQENNL